MIENDTYSTPLLVFCQAAFETWVRSEEFSRLMRKTGIVSGNKFGRLLLFIVQASAIIDCAATGKNTVVIPAKRHLTAGNDQKRRESSTFHKLEVTGCTFIVAVDKLLLSTELIWKTGIPYCHLKGSICLVPSRRQHSPTEREAICAYSKQDGMHKLLRYMSATVGPCRA